MDALRNAWIDASKPTEQLRLAREIQVAALRHAVHIPTGQSFNQTAWTTKLADVPDGLHVFWGARFT